MKRHKAKLKKMRKTNRKKVKWKIKIRLGRPPKKVKEINPVRQIGQWTDEDWKEIVNAACHRDMNTAEWAKRVLKRAARR